MIELHQKSGDPTSLILFHCALRACLPDILREGLDPERSQSSLKAVFVADDEFTAANYACMREGDAVMLSIDATALDPCLLGPDNYELPDMLESLDQKFLKSMGYSSSTTWDQVSGMDSLRICNQAAYRGVIPPSAITVIEGRFLVPAKDRLCP